MITTFRKSNLKKGTKMKTQSTDVGFTKRICVVELKERRGQIIKYSYSIDAR